MSEEKQELRAHKENQENWEKNREQLQTEKQRDN